MLQKVPVVFRLTQGRGKKNGETTEVGEVPVTMREVEFSVLRIDVCSVVIEVVDSSKIKISIDMYCISLGMSSLTA